MAKHVRKKEQQAFVWAHLIAAREFLIGVPVAMSFCRFGRHMDADNNGSSFKHVQDGICRHFGIDDGSIPIVYSEIVSSIYGFSVMIRMEQPPWETLQGEK